MTSIELLISIFGDEAPKQLIENESPTNLDEHKLIAGAGGDIAGKARKLFEDETGKPVSSSSNHLDKKKRPSLRDGEK